MRRKDKCNETHWGGTGRNKTNMAGEVVVDALPYFDQGYDETGVRDAVSIHSLHSLISIKHLFRPPDSSGHSSFLNKYLDVTCFRDNAILSNY